MNRVKHNKLKATAGLSTRWVFVINSAFGSRHWLMLIILHLCINVKSLSIKVGLLESDPTCTTWKWVTFQRIERWWMVWYWRMSMISFILLICCVCRELRWTPKINEMTPLGRLKVFNSIYQFLGKSKSLRTHLLRSQTNVDGFFLKPGQMPRKKQNTN